MGKNPQSISSTDFYLRIAGAYRLMLPFEVKCTRYRRWEKCERPVRGGRRRPALPALWGLYVACSHDLMMTSAAKTETCLHSLIHSKARLHHKLWHVNESSIFLFYVLSVALLLKNNTPPLVFLFSAMPLHNKKKKVFSLEWSFMGHVGGLSTLSLLFLINWS